ncbi:hypothetical protein ACOME3_006508 [Neoechinorhynchus agilis]
MDPNAIEAETNVLVSSVQENLPVERKRRASSSSSEVSIHVDPESPNQSKSVVASTKRAPIVSLIRLNPPIKPVVSSAPGLTANLIENPSCATINGTPIFDLDLNQLKDEEKPWLKPGADITDYFNYGFNEETWTVYSMLARVHLYCIRQRTLRTENGPYNRPQSLLSQMYRTKQAGTINVIGSTDETSRRSQQPLQSTISPAAAAAAAALLQAVRPAPPIVTMPLAPPPPPPHPAPPQTSTFGQKEEQEDRPQSPVDRWENPNTRRIDTPSLDRSRPSRRPYRRRSRSPRDDRFRRDAPYRRRSRSRHDRRRRTPRRSRSPIRRLSGRRD